MMTIKCDIVKDILPLYVDDLCSEETKKLVDEHLKNCRECREALSVMQSSLSPEITFNKEELQKKRAPFKKIRSRVILLCVGLVILTSSAVRCIPEFYQQLTMEKYDIEIEISSDVRDIDFELLAAELASTVKADEEKLFWSFDFKVGRDWSIEDFSGQFIAILNDKPVKFHTRNFKENRFQVVQTPGVSLSKEEVLTQTDLSLSSLSLLNQIPWAHLEENITMIDYDYLSVSNFRTGDGEGNLRVHALAAKSYLVDESGEITRIEEEIVLPSRQYRVITFTPLIFTDESKTSASGSLVVEYFFKVNDWLTQ